MNAGSAFLLLVENVSAAAMVSAMCCSVTTLTATAKRPNEPRRNLLLQRGSSAKDFRTARVSGRLHEIYQLLCANCHSKKTKENGEFKRRDITNIETPSLPLLEWGKIPSFVEQRMDSE